MKKYIIFEFDDLFLWLGDSPIGGIGDIRAMYDHYPDAIEHIQNSRYDVAYVVDRDTWKILLEKGNKDEG